MRGVGSDILGAMCCGASMLHVACGLGLCVAVTVGVLLQVRVPWAGACAGCGGSALWRLHWAAVQRLRHRCVCVHGRVCLLFAWQRCIELAGMEWHAHAVSLSGLRRANAAA